MTVVHFITHPEVIIDPAVPVPDWPLSPVGIRRMRLAMERPLFAAVRSVFCSAGRKATDAASIMASHDDVFFIENGVVSLAADTHDQGRVEVGLLGREGFAGASVILNADPWSVHRAFTQVAGDAYRMSAAALRSAVEQSESLRHRCLRHVEMLMVQTSQVAACNARHNLPERLARWLLMVRDRIDSDNLPMTQEFLSVMRAFADRACLSRPARFKQAG